MKWLVKSFFSPPSLRLSVVVVCGVVSLLSLSLGVMFYFSHKAVHREASLDADQTLEATVKHIDNILLSVEQSSGNIYRELVNNLDQPERMKTYCRQLVECNPYIVGCAICFKPDYYPGRKLFMTYVHRRGGGVKADGTSDLVESASFGSKPYTERVWYSLPMSTGRSCWTDPQPSEEDEGVTLSFCVPIVGVDQKPVGVMVADLSVDLLSQLVLTANTSPDRYSVLLGSDGSFIVHPNQKKRSYQTVYSLIENDNNSSLRKAVEAMMAGETGHGSFQLNGHSWYVFYKPFLITELQGRAREKVSWSIGVVYSEDVIFGNFNRLLGYVLVISVLGLLVFYLLCRFVTRRQMKPLRQLTYVTKRIAEGHYDEPMPNIKRDDEIGQLYSHFQLMEQSLATHVNELNQLVGRLKNRREVMHEIYAKDQSVDRVKSSFLHYVTNQMVAPADDIKRYVNNLCDGFHALAPEELALVTSSIDKKSTTLIGLINQMLNTADSEAGKEADHE